MTVRSYSQNFEDVLLWRVLRDVPDGTYVDVGAGHPELHSVTKLFYDQGWSGINIEPVPELAQLLSERRPRDTNLHAAVGSGTGETVDLTVVPLWDELSTTDPARRRELEAEGRSLETVTVPVVRLSDAIEAAGVTEVHFLKVDVEGGELEVLGTLDLARTRPWIIVVEVVGADSSAKRGRDVRQLLEARGYVFAYFDGLNEFYAAEERSEALLPFFAVPVNVRDDFTAVSDGDSVVVDLVGEKLGMVPPVQASELLQRVEALLHDRITFEARLLEHGDDPTASVRERDQEQLRAMSRTINEQESALRSLRLKSESLDLSLFERDRMIAWYAAQVANLRAASETNLRESQRQVRESQDLVTALRASTSWKVTLPLRVLRRPMVYLRVLVRR